MEIDNFKKWCDLKTSKLKSYIIYWWFNEFIMIILSGLILFFTYFINYILVDIIHYGKSYSSPIVYLSFPLSILIIWLLNRILNPSISSRIEFLSCLLNKIAKEIELLQSNINETELFKDLKIFKKISKIKFVLTNQNLFKKENEAQKNFYALLNSFSDRINYSINQNRIGEINLEDINKLAFYLYTDDVKKTEILEKIARDNPDIENIKFDIKKYASNNYFKLLFYLITLLIFFYFFIYKLLGIDKSATFLGFITLYGIIIYVIFKK